MGKVIQFPRATDVPCDLIGALVYFRTRPGALSRVSPPVDATGEFSIDTYLAVIFAGLTRMNAATRIQHLNEKAAQQEGNAERCLADARRSQVMSERFSEAARIHAATAKTLRSWATQIHDAAIAATEEQQQK